MNKHEIEVLKLGIDVPAWIDQDITATSVSAIVQGGCASGAYMPAVTYHNALTTMSEHGDDILDYITDVMGELPAPDDGESWAGMACHYLSAAVELWASSVDDEIDDIIDALPEYGVGFGFDGCPYDSIQYYSDFDDAKQAAIDRMIELEDCADTEAEAEAWSAMQQHANLQSKPFSVVMWGRVICVWELDENQAIEAWEDES